jgi:hypothetical protein
MEQRYSPIERQLHVHREPSLLQRAVGVYCVCNSGSQRRKQHLPLTVGYPTPAVYRAPQRFRVLLTKLPQQGLL